MRLFIFLICLISFSAFGQENVQNVDAVTFNKFIVAGGYELIDLRTPGEISKKGKIPGAREIDFLATDSEKEIEALDHNKKYLLYCAGGGRSSDCASLMSGMRFKTIINLEGGFDAWSKKGFPVEQKKQ